MQAFRQVERLRQHDLDDTMAEAMRRSLERVSRSQDSLHSVSELLHRTQKAMEDSRRMLAKSQQLAINPLSSRWQSRIRRTNGSDSSVHPT